MSYRSNAAEAWYTDRSPRRQSPRFRSICFRRRGLTQPLWRSLAGNLRDTSRGEAAAARTHGPARVCRTSAWRASAPALFRTVFTNIGDVISPENTAAARTGIGSLSMSVNSSRSAQPLLVGIAAAESCRPRRGPKPSPPSISLLNDSGRHSEVLDPAADVVPK